MTKDDLMMAGYSEQEIDKVMQDIEAHNTYYYAIPVTDIDTQRPIHLSLTVGKDDITIYDIAYLMLSDKRESSSNHNEDIHTDPRIEHLKMSDDIDTVKAIDILSKSSNSVACKDPYDILFPDDDPNAWIVDRVSEVIHNKLTRKQSNAVYDHYGASKTLVEIGIADKKTKVAAYKRIAGAINKTKKTLAKDGIDENSIDRFGVFTKPNTK